MKLEIGGGTIPEPGWVNLDPVHGAGDFKRYAQDGIPITDNSVDEARASHVMEHIPAGQPRITVMNEVHRVLKPGGVFTIIGPLIGAYGTPIQTWHAWADPTHVSYWWMPESFLYFCEGPFKANADYDVRIWAELDEEKDTELRNGWEGVVRMRKP